MRKHTDGQLEVVLENRQLLITFFVVVALCGVFFSLGYIVGRNTLGVVRVTQAAASGTDSANKPSPMPPPAYNQTAQTPPAADTSPDQPAQPTDLNFYQSVEEKKPDAKLESPEPAKAAVPPAPSAASAPAPAQASAPSPAPKPPAAQAPSGILVQVSALTRREDANALVNLLQDKNLPVLVVPGPNDNLFHVVVGPYTNQKDADHAKAVLELEGFRPIIKR